jgi:hypothetical protein
MSAQIDGAELLADEWNGAELADSDEPELESLPVFLQPNIVIKGWAHIIAAAPKAGKTTLLAHVVRDWLDQGLRVLWLTEEPKSVWRRRLRRLGGDWSRLTLRPGEPSQEPELRERAATGPWDVVIVDTIRQFLPVKDWNDAANIASAVRPWVAAVSRSAEKTLLLAHHARKGGGEHGEEIAGSHELYAAVDVGIIIKHYGEDAQRRRKLTAAGREIEPTSVLYEMADDKARTLRCLGSPDAVSLATVQTRILEVLSVEGIGTEAVRNALEEPRPSRQQVLNALTALAESQRIRREPPIGTSVQGKRPSWFAANFTRPPTLPFGPLEVTKPLGSEYKLEPEGAYSQSQLHTVDNLGAGMLEVPAPTGHKTTRMRSLADINVAGQ